jgi:hypothetical protein
MADGWLGALSDGPSGVIASEAEQSRTADIKTWIASSPVGLLAMTTVI